MTNADDGSTPPTASQALESTVNELLAGGVRVSCMWVAAVLIGGEAL